MDVFKIIIGWCLLIVGIVLIGWTLLTSYNIFTGEALAPAVFEVPEEVLTQEGGTDLQAQMEQMIGEQLKGILPTDSIPKLLNLIIWSMLAFILIFGGTQLAGLGTKLIKK